MPPCNFIVVECVTAKQTNVRPRMIRIWYICGTTMLLRATRKILQSQGPWPEGPGPLALGGIWGGSVEFRNEAWSRLLSSEVHYVQTSQALISYYKCEPCVYLVLHLWAARPFVLALRIFETHRWPWAIKAVCGGKTKIRRRTQIIIIIYRYLLMHSKWISLEKTHK